MLPTLTYSISFPGLGKMCVSSPNKVSSATKSRLVGDSYPIGIRVTCFQTCGLFCQIFGDQEPPFSRPIFQIAYILPCVQRSGREHEMVAKVSSVVIHLRRKNRNVQAGCNAVAYIHELNPRAGKNKAAS